MKKRLISLIVLCIMLGSCGSQPSDIIEDATIKTDYDSPSGSSKTEIAETPSALNQEVGFDSPEDAVWEYLEGLKNHDLNRMISTFAIETYVQHHAFEAMLERYGLDHESAKRLNITPPTAETRLHEITSYIIYQLWYLNASEFGKKDFTDFADEAISEEEISSFFSEHWDNNPDISLLNTGTLIGFIPPEMLVEDEQERQIFLSNQFFHGNIVDYTDVPYSELPTGIRQHKYTGTDEFEDLVAVVEFDDNLLMTFVDACRYGDRWYLESFGGAIGAVVSISAQLKSVFFPTELFISESELKAIMIPA